LGRGFAAPPTGTEPGIRSFGSARDRENAPLADRCLPTFGLFIATS
jgi:hypothetical protein